MECKRSINLIKVALTLSRFRWVECQLEALRKCRTALAIEAALSTLPETLDATYERILQSIEENDQEHARRTLELLAFSKRPLRVEEVAEAIVVVPGCKPFDIDERFFDTSDVCSCTRIETTGIGI